MATAPPIPTNQGGVQTGLPKLPGPSARRRTASAEVMPSGQAKTFIPTSAYTPGPRWNWRSGLTPREWEESHLSEQDRAWRDAGGQKFIDPNGEVVYVGLNDLWKTYGKPGWLVIPWPGQAIAVGEGGGGVYEPPEAGFSNTGFTPLPPPTGEKLFPPTAPGLPSPRPTGQRTQPGGLTPAQEAEYKAQGYFKVYGPLGQVQWASPDDWDTYQAAGWTTAPQAALPTVTAPGFQGTGIYPTSPYQKGKVGVAPPTATTRPTSTTTVTPTRVRLPGPSGPTTTLTRPTSTTTVGPPPVPTPTPTPPPPPPEGTPSGPGPDVTPRPVPATSWEWDERLGRLVPVLPGPPGPPAPRGYQPQRVTDEASAYAVLGNPPPGGPEGFLVEITPIVNAETGEWQSGGYFNMSTRQWVTDPSVIASHQQMVNAWEAYEIDRTRAMDFLGGQDITAQQEIQNNYQNAQLELDKWKADMAQQNNQINEELRRRELELDTFIRNGQLEEAITSRQQSRELEQAQMRMQFILAIASNPAALFMLNQMGQLGQMTQGLGIDLTGLMANFQAAVPQEFLARMPNTQQWARLSPQIQQMILAYHMSRTGKTADQLLTEQRQQAPGSVGGTPQMIVR